MSIADNSGAEFKDALNREWVDISSEMYREYLLKDGQRLRIDTPGKLLVSASGGGASRLRQRQMLLHCAGLAGD